MPDFEASEPGDRPTWTAAQIGALLGAEIIGDPSASFSTLGAIDQAQSDALTFIRSAKFAKRWATSKASAVLVSRAVYLESSASLRPGEARAILIVPDADLAMLTLLEVAAESMSRVHQGGVHPSAVIDPSATLGADVSIAAGVTVEAGSRIGDRTRLHPGVRIGAGVTIGADCDLRANVVIEDRCLLGDRVLIQPGAVIGADGFGYRPNPDAPGVLKIPHIGAVQIGDDVEIGANTCIDRGKFSNTTVGPGTKIDNMIQIGHNVTIGSHTIICGNTGIGGSAKVGSGVTIGGACAIHDGVSIGDGATLAARSGVMRDIPSGGTYGGAPAISAREYLRQLAALQHLPAMLHDYRRRTAADIVSSHDRSEARPS